MKRTAIIPGLVTATLVTGAANVHSQARGPSHAQVREQGQHIQGGKELREAALQEALDRAEEERIALQDPAERARRIAGLQTILRRLPGRFRIEGRIERPTDAVNSLKGDVRGVADCAAVGDGTGVNCIINASWPVIEPIRPGPVLIEPRPPSEQLNAMRPAVLVVGMNIDPPGLRAMMVTADSLASNWVGFLQGRGVNLTRPSRCWSDARCYQTFQLTIGPDSSNTSFVLAAHGYTMTCPKVATSILRIVDIAPKARFAAARSGFDSASLCIAAPNASFRVACASCPGGMWIAGTPHSRVAVVGRPAAGRDARSTKDPAARRCRHPPPHPVPACARSIATWPGTAARRTCVSSSRSPMKLSATASHDVNHRGWLPARTNGRGRGAVRAVRPLLPCGCRKCPMPSRGELAERFCL